jgi:TRAP-type uncharacterized transport system substrate-binding protein
MIDPEKYIEDKLELLRTSRKIQKRIIFILIVLLLGLAAKFAYELLPRHFNLSLTGGGLLSNRHHLAKILSEEAEQQHLSIRVMPTTGSTQAMDLVDTGKLDLAFIQGGLDPNYENIRHVATISPELIHVLVKPGIESIKDIRGKTVNMGSLEGGTRIVAKQIFDLSGLKNGVDYVEKNFRERDLIEMRPERLPDVIILISYAPSDVVDVMVKKHGYDLLEMPFPPSLAIRLGWVADAKILGYMYSIVPAVPPKDIQVIGVDLHLIANKNVDPRAVAAVIETLYGPRVTNRFGQKIPESELLSPSGFPISAGTELYLSRKEPLLTEALMDKLKALFGLLMTLGSTLLVLFKWFTMEEKKDDQEGNESSDKDSEKVTEPMDDGKSAKKPKPEAILSKLGEATDHIKKLSQ